MAKTTVPLRDANQASRPVVGEQLPGGLHLVQHVATAIRTILGYGFASVTTVVGLPNIPALATHAYVTVESGGDDIRWRSDGGTPVEMPTNAAGAGMRCPAGGAFEIALADLTQVKVVSVGTIGPAVICVEYARLDA